MQIDVDCDSIGGLYRKIFIKYLIKKQIKKFTN